MGDQKRYRYGISDIILEEDQEPSKYVQVFDVHGKFIIESEVYFIEEEDMKEE